jgi:hypothetical protein
MYRCVLAHYWQDDASGNQQKFLKYFMLFQPWNWYRENYTIKSTIYAVKFQIQYSYLHSNISMCIAKLLTRWYKRQSAKILKISHDISTLELIPWKLQHCSITNQEYQSATLYIDGPCCREIWRFVYPKKPYLSRAKLHISLQQGPYIVYYTEITRTKTFFLN